MTIRLPDAVRFISRGWLNSNSILFLGDAPLLIDTGYESHVSMTIDLIHANEVGVADIAMIVHTHCHSDHVGATKMILDQSRAKTAMHPIEGAWVTAGERHLTWLDYLDQNAAPFHVDIELNDGDLLRAGEWTLQVLHTPGHSPGGIALYCPELNVLFSGDTIWQGDLGSVNVPIHGETAFFHALASLDKLAALNAQVVFPGHGHPIVDVASNFHRVRERLNGFIANRQKMAMHALKQYFIFTLMLKDGFRDDQLADYISQIPAFVDYSERYLDTEPRALLPRLLDELSGRGHIVLRWRLACHGSKIRDLSGFSKPDGSVV